MKLQTNRIFSRVIITHHAFGGSLSAQSRHQLPNLRKKKLSGLATGEPRSSNQYEDRTKGDNKTGCRPTACRTVKSSGRGILKSFRGASMHAGHFFKFSAVFSLLKAWFRPELRKF